MTERSWWGWGTTDRALTDDECVALAAAAPGPARPPAPRPGGSTDLELPASRIATPAVACRSPPTPAARASHTYGKAYRDVVRALAGDLGARTGRGRVPARPRPTSSPCSTGPGRPASSSSPSAAAAPSSAGVEYRGERPVAVAGPHRPGPRAGGRPGQPGRPDPGRRARPGARGAAPPARPDAAALPAELRVLHARRLAGHPRRRPLRHAAHPHRRPGRVDARRDAGRGQRVVAAAGVGRRARRPTGCSSAPRARSASSPRRGCGCRTGRGSRRSASVTVRGHDRRDGRRPGDLPGRAAPGELPAARPRRGGAVGSGVVRLRPCSCWAWSRRSIPVESRLAELTGPGAATHGGVGRPGGRRDGRRPPTPGARRSCGCPTCATGWPG